MSTLAVIYKIGADISGLKDGIDQAAASTKRLEEMAENLGKGLGALFAVSKIVAFGNEVLDAGDKIQKMADQTGIERILDKTAETIETLCDLALDGHQPSELGGSR